MRMLSPAYVVATVVIAVTGSAFAQSVARPAGTNTATSLNKTASTPTVGTNRTSATANETTTPSTNNGNVTSTTVTNADGSTTTTFSNGLTNNSGGVNGSRSGTNTASSAANAPGGSTSANGTAASTGNGNTTNGSRTGVNTNVNAATTVNQGVSSTGLAGALAPGVVTPAIINGSLGTITSDGERVFDNVGNVVDLGNANVQLVNNGSAGTAVTTETARSSRSLDKAIKQTENDRKRIGRNGQLLQSITPRTNVDRTDQMPDDGPTPALTGSASTLMRR